MALQNILDGITEAQKNGDVIEFKMTGKLPDNDIATIADHIKNLTGKDIKAGLFSASKSKQTIELKFTGKEKTFLPISGNSIPPITSRTVAGIEPSTISPIAAEPDVRGIIAKGAEFLPAGGAMLGAILAAPTIAAAPYTAGGSLPATVALGSAGAALGAAGGEFARQGILGAIGQPSPVPLSRESLFGAGKIGITAGALEMLGGAMVPTALKVGEAILSRSKVLVKPGYTALKNIADKFKVKLLPSDISSSPWLKRFENLMDNTWLGADAINDVRIAQMEAIRLAKTGLQSKYGTLLSTEQIGKQTAETAADILKRKQTGIAITGEKLSEKYGTKLSTEEINKVVTGAIIDKSKTENAIIKDIYEKRNALIDMQREVPIKNTLMASNRIQSAEQKAIVRGDSDLLSITAGFSKAVSGSSIVPRRATFETVSDAITKINDKIVQENAIAMQSGLKGVAGQSTQKGRLLVQIKQGLQKDLDNYLRTQPKNARALNTLAKKKYSEFAQIFKSDEIRDLADKDPMAIVTYLINTGRIKEFDMVKRAIGTEGIKPIQQRFFQDVIEKAIPGEGVLKAKAIDKVLQDYRPEILGRIFSKTQIAELKSLSKTITGIPKNLKILAEKDPMQMVKYLINPARTQEFDSALKVLNKEGITPLQQRFFQDIVDTAIPETGVLNIGAIDKVLKTYKPEILNRVMEPQAVNELREISLLINNLSLKGQTHKVTSLAHVIGIGTGATAITSPYIAATATITPYVLSKFYVSPIGRKLLIEGLKLPSGTKPLADFTKRISQFMILQGITPNAEK